MSENQIQKSEESPDKLSGTYSEAHLINDRLRWAQQEAHLVSPATAAGSLPDGCGVAFCMVLVDSRADGYPIEGGKVGLSKTALQKIGAATGISWDPHESGRQDDGSNPHYCRWKAVGAYRSFDGQVQTVVAEKELDLRDGSPQVLHLKPKQLEMMRQFIQGHCETKAQLRAIRSLGIKTSYTQEELTKPFVCARVMFTGRSKDPEMQREFSRMTAESFLGGGRALYGAPRVTQPARLPQPPIDATSSDSGEWPADQTAPAANQPQPAAAQAKPAVQQAPQVVHVLPGGPNKGTPIDKAATKDLNYWANRIAGDLEQNESRDPERDSALHKALCDELKRREGQY